MLNYIQRLNYLDFGDLFGLMEESLFGVLLDIRQGGYYASAAYEYTIKFPISFPKMLLGITCITDGHISGSDRNYPVIKKWFSNSVTIINSTYENRYIAIGY